MNITGGVGDWNPSINYSRVVKTNPIDDIKEAQKVANQATSGPVDEGKNVGKTEQAEALSKSKMIDLQDRTIRFEIEKGGQVITKFKDNNGISRQIPAEEAIKTSERIRNYLDRIANDVKSASLDEFRLVDIRV